ncbi:inositol hexakisphosphate and diphosphoinositol-pentakisphosphate kinase [Cystobasidiomycetes sp. EMM_F5]
MSIQTDGVRAANDGTPSAVSKSSDSSIRTPRDGLSMPNSPVPSSDKQPKPKQMKLGVCAMDRKARSKPMRNILSRLLASGKFEIMIFGDKCILDEDVENWPLCDFLLSFHSDGFPLDKAIRYVHLRNPICINDLSMQKVFWDRRVVLAILDHIGVRTPPRIEVDRDGGPAIDKRLSDIVFRDLGIRLDAPRPKSQLTYDEDKVEAGGKVIHKPFVEKPASGEDHNVYIYYSSKRGGGGRRLFRKIGNKSSELDPDLSLPRTDGSFVYEQFMDVENAEDIKAYTLGPHFVHAETRKSPAVDGVVRRNTDGKELRYVTELTDDEKDMASKIATAFRQNVCGFDLLRANGKSYVIDVNGWSFVKGNDFYYDKCAEILERFCTDQSARPKPMKTPSQARVAEPNAKDKSWVLKGAVSTFRHADRTPKMKLKFNIKGSWSWSAPFIDLLQGRRDEIILRADEQLQFIADAAKEAMQHPEADQEMLASLNKILQAKIGVAGTKAQLKPTFHGDKCEKLNIIVKWGGEFTHAGRYQSRDLGANMREDYAILNPSLLDNLSICSSSERRAIATAEIYASSLLNHKTSTHTSAEPHQMTIRKDLLDDSNAAKEPMDAVKKRLKVLLRPGEYKRPEFAMAWRVPDVEPQQVVQETVELLRYHRKVMRENWAKLDVEDIQSRWCCSEYPALWKERWDKIFVEFCDVEPEKFDPSRISELYDSIKYDALHNQIFLETIFTPSSQHESLHGGDGTPGHGTSALNAPLKLKELYEKAKILFDYIAPAEYGIEKAEKLQIGVLTSWPLLKQVLEDLETARTSESGYAAFYFTKESHIQTLVNLVLLSDLPIVMPQLPELDYMSYITFELYERIKNDAKEFSIRIALSEGAHSLPLDASLDAKHALSVQPRRVLTNHIPFPQAYETLQQYAESTLYKKSSSTFEGMLPVEGDELFSGLKHELVQIIDMDFSHARPHSVASNHDGTASETSSIAG